jgi:hypothetical protein
MRVCKVCQHPRREAIDAATIDGQALTSIAAKFSSKNLTLSRSSIFRHRSHILPGEPPYTHTESPPEVATPLLNRIENLMVEANQIALAAKSQQQWMAAVSALRETRCCLEFLAKLKGELVASGVTINIAHLAQPEGAQSLVQLIKTIARDPAQRKVFASTLSEHGFLSPTLNIVFVSPGGTCSEGTKLERPQARAGAALEPEHKALLPPTKQPAAKTLDLPATPPTDEHVPEPTPPEDDAKALWDELEARPQPSQPKQDVVASRSYPPWYGRTM